jgi:NAD(P)-dependent dehydrogenase (short-subunit alcohol dehydrogenase family)
LPPVFTDHNTTQHRVNEILSVFLPEPVHFSLELSILRGALHVPQEEVIMSKDRVVLITGATGGVGKVVSMTMAEGGYRLALTSRSEDALESIAEDLGIPRGRFMVYAADITRESEVQQLVRTVVERMGGIDILVNIAGGWMGGKKIQDMSEREWDRAIDLNLRSAFLVNRAVLPHMSQRGWGRIINFSSKAAETPAPKQAAYNVAKAGVVALTASIAVEYRRNGIAANVLLPSIIDTQSNRAQIPDADFTRWVKPGELGSLILFLCSDEGGSLNGASIPVYGKL